MPIKKIQFDTSTVQKVTYDGDEVAKIVYDGNVVFLQAYQLSVTKGTGVSTIYYRQGTSGNWNSTTGSLNMQVDYGLTMQWYATAQTGYTADASCYSASNPCQLVMSRAGASYHPTATPIGLVVDATAGEGITNLVLSTDPTGETEVYTPPHTFNYGDTVYAFVTIDNTAYNPQSTWTTALHGSYCVGSVYVDSAKDFGTISARRKTYYANFGTTSGQTFYGSWSQNKSLIYHGDKITTSGNVVTCYKYNDLTVARWTNTASASAKSAQYSYSTPTVSGGSVTAVTDDVSITAANTRTVNSYSVSVSSTNATAQVALSSSGPYSSSVTASYGATIYYKITPNSHYYYLNGSTKYYNTNPFTSSMALTLVNFSFNTSTNVATHAFNACSEITYTFSINEQANSVVNYSKSASPTTKETITATYTNTPLIYVTIIPNERFEGTIGSTRYYHTNPYNTSLSSSTIKSTWTYTDAQETATYNGSSLLNVVAIQYHATVGRALCRSVGFKKNGTWETADWTNITYSQLAAKLVDSAIGFLPNKHYAIGKGLVVGVPTKYAFYDYSTEAFYIGNGETGIQITDFTFNDATKNASYYWSTNDVFVGTQMFETAYAWKPGIDSNMSDYWSSSTSSSPTSKELERTLGYSYQELSSSTLYFKILANQYYAVNGTNVSQSVLNLSVSDFDVFTTSTQEESTNLSNTSIATYTTKKCQPMVYTYYASIGQGSVDLTAQGSSSRPTGTYFNKDTTNVHFVLTPSNYYYHPYPTASSSTIATHTSPGSWDCNIGETAKLMADSIIYTDTDQTCTINMTSCTPFNETIQVKSIANGTVYWSTSPITTSGGTTTLTASYNSTVYWRIQANTGYSAPATYYGSMKLSTSNFNIGSAVAASTATYKGSAIGDCTPNTYTITLDGNSIGTAGQATVVYNTSTLSTYTPSTATGYTLTGYYTAQSGGTMVINNSGALQANISGYTDASGKWIKASNVTLYAQWTLQAYSVNFNVTSGQYGSWSTSSFSNVAYGTALSRSGNVVTVTNYGSSTFTKPSVTVQYNYADPTYSTIPSTVTGTTNISAGSVRSDRKYTIRWLNGNGSVIETDTNVAYGDVLWYNSASLPTKASTEKYTYTFTGWKYNGSDVYSGVTTNPGSTTTTTLDMIPQFSATERSYTVTLSAVTDTSGLATGSWKNSSGTVVTSVSALYSASISVSANVVTIGSATFTYTKGEDTAYNSSYSITGASGTVGTGKTITGTTTYVRKTFFATFNFATSDPQYGSWGSSKQTVVYGDQITITGTTVTCYKWDAIGTARWTNVFTVNSPTAQYTYSASITQTSGSSPVTSAITLTAATSRTVRSYAITVSATNCTCDKASGTYEYGTVLTFTRNTGYAYSSSGTTTETKTVTGAGTYSSSPQYAYLTINATNCSCDKSSAWYYIPDNTLVSATFTANTNYSYSTPELTSTQTPAAVVMDEPRIISSSPSYVKATYTATNCSCARVSGKYYSAGSVTFTANSGYAFNSSGTTTTSKTWSAGASIGTVSPTYVYLTLSGINCGRYDGSAAGWYAIGSAISTRFRANTNYSYSTPDLTTYETKTIASISAPSTLSSSPAYVSCSVTYTNCSGRTSGKYYTAGSFTITANTNYRFTSTSNTTTGTWTAGGNAGSFSPTYGYVTVNANTNSSVTANGTGWYVIGNSITSTWTVSNTTLYTFASSGAAQNTTTKSWTASAGLSVAGQTVYDRLYTVTLASAASPSEVGTSGSWKNSSGTVVTSVSATYSTSISRTGYAVITIGSNTYEYFEGTPITGYRAEDISISGASGTVGTGTTVTGTTTYSRITWSYTIKLSNMSSVKYSTNGGTSWTTITSNTTVSDIDYAATLSIQGVSAPTGYNPDTTVYSRTCDNAGGTITISGSLKSYTISFPSTTYGAWGSASKTAYHNDYLSRSGNTWTCKIGGSSGSTRWTNTLTASAQTSQYTYTATAAGSNFTVTGAATAGSATSSRTERSYTVTLATESSVSGLSSGNWIDTNTGAYVSSVTALYSDEIELDSPLIYIGQDGEYFYEKGEETGYDSSYTITGASGTVGTGKTVTGTTTYTPAELYTWTITNGSGTTSQQGAVNNISMTSYSGTITITGNNLSGKKIKLSGWSHAQTILTNTSGLNGTISAVSTDNPTSSGTSCSRLATANTVVMSYSCRIASQSFVLTISDPS